jgi:DNA repair exonuclease SbcCD ATPase subunit
MIKFYDSLKETLQRSKATSMAIARLKGSNALTFNDEMEEFEKLVVDRLGRLKAAVKEGEAVVADEVQHAEQVAESLTANIAALDAQLKETEDTVRKKDLASQKMETTLTAKNHDLQSEMKKKEKILESRDNEVNDLKSKIDVLVMRVTELELAIQQAKAEATSEDERVAHVTEGFRARIAALETQLSQTEERIRGKESTIEELEQNLGAKIQELENQLRNKEKLLTSRDRRVNDLESQLKFLTGGIKEMSSFFRQTEGLADSEMQDPGGQLKTEQEKPGTSQFQGAGFTSDTTPAPQEILSPDFFNRMTHELIQAIGPFASMILRDDVKALGESIEAFPTARLTELVDMISKEILNEDMKIGFRKWVAESVSTPTGSRISQISSFKLS